MASQGGGGDFSSGEAAPGQRGWTALAALFGVWRRCYPAWGDSADSDSVPRGVERRQRG